VAAAADGANVAADVAQVTVRGATIIVDRASRRAARAV
jgi:hypothetical protein